jgi:hypothetical protein
MTTPEHKKEVLKSKIEQEVFKLVNLITEGTFDFVNVKTITERKIVDPSQRALISEVLEMVKTSNRTILVNSLDLFQKSIDKTLTEFQASSEEYATPANKKIKQQ